MKQTLFVFIFVLLAGCAPPSEKEMNIVGKWVEKNHEGITEFTEDGMASVTINGTKQSTPFFYSSQSGSLAMRFDSSNTITLTVKFEDPNTMIINFPDGSPPRKLVRIGVQD